MTSKLIVNSIRHTGASADGITLDASGNVTFPANATCSGTATGFGAITMADQWRLTSGLSVPSSDTVISANWERVDATAQGTLGTGMTQSSGVFTFPQTGIYLVRFQGYFEENTSTSQAQVEMRATTDGSSYSSIAFSVCSISNISTYTYNNIQMESLIDVTNVSNVKVFWKAYSATATVLDGSSTQNRTYATFIRLGDT